MTRNLMKKKKMHVRTSYTDKQDLVHSREVGWKGKWSYEIKLGGKFVQYTTNSWENFTGKCQKRDIIMGAQTKTMPELVD